ncbi:MAG TPA: hypothetical protein VLK60_13320 [Variovorax sp.]|nr:hypothetical protein [Variovorax sp.]
MSIIDLARRKWRSWLRRCRNAGSAMSRNKLELDMGIGLCERIAGVAAGAWW